jgi:hypothetical protein
MALVYSTNDAVSYVELTKRNAPVVSRRIKPSIPPYARGVKDVSGRAVLRTAMPGHVERVESLNLEAAERAVGHADGRVTVGADAPVFPLTTPDAAAVSIAMTVRTAAAEGRSRRRQGPHRS